MKSMLILVAASLFAVQSITAAPINITAPDGQDDGRTGPGYNETISTEDQNLNFTSSWSQEFDLEAFYYDADSSKLSMISGFDVFSGHEQGIYLGDIFIKTSGSSTWDYVIAFNRGTKKIDGVIQNVFLDNSYKIVDVSGGYTLLPLTGNYQKQKPEAQPYAITNYDETNVKYNGFFTYEEKKDTYLGLLGDYHYDMGGLNLSVLGTNSFQLHLTESCGNDIIKASVPEPAILSLLGLGLIGISFLRRKRNN